MEVKIPWKCTRGILVTPWESLCNSCPYGVDFSLSQRKFCRLEWLEQRRSPRRSQLSHFEGRSLGIGGCRECLKCSNIPFLSPFPEASGSTSKAGRPLFLYITLEMPMIHVSIIFETQTNHVTFCLLFSLVIL